MGDLTATENNEMLPWQQNMLQRAIFLSIAALLLLSLQFQTLPLRIQVQTLPLTTVFALLFFPFIVVKLPRSPLLSILTVFVCFALLHSLTALLFDLFAGNSDNRFIAFLRQSFALIAGLITFLVFRTVFQYVSLRQIFRFIVWGTVPALLLTILNIFWGAFGQDWAGTIVSGVRDFISPEGFTSPFRASGFATEPAAFATSLVVTLLPTLFVVFRERRSRKFALVLLVLAALSFAWTFSTIGLILLLTVLVAGMFLGPQRKMMFVTVALFLGLTFSATILFPNNQILRHAGTLLAGRANVSFTDRYYSAFGPFMESLSSFSVVGYGLGGISTHFREVVPTRVQDEILAAKWKEFPNLAIIFGRLYAETGAVGLALFLVAVWMTFRELRAVMRSERGHNFTLEYSSIRLGWIAVCVSMLISIGPYHTPYLWLWMALIDSKYAMLAKGELQ